MNDFEGLNLVPSPASGEAEIVLTTILLIFGGIISAIIISLIGALILWGCASGIAKIKNATLLNSWALFWILIVV